MGRTGAAGLSRLGPETIAKIRRGIGWLLRFHINETKHELKTRQPVKIEDVVIILDLVNISGSLSSVVVCEMFSSLNFLPLYL